MSTQTTFIAKITLDTALGQKIWESEAYTTRTAALDAIEIDRDGTLEWAKRQARQLRALFPTCPPLTVRVEIVERLTESDVTDTVTIEQEYEI